MNGTWIFFKHKERDLVDSRRASKKGKTIFKTAQRELKEENGALNYSIQLYFIE